MKARAGRLLLAGLLPSLVVLPHALAVEIAGAKRSEYDVRLENPASNERADAVYRAENPSHNLSFVFVGAELRAVPRVVQVPVFWLEISAASLIKPSRVGVSGNRIDHDFGAVRQWYVNGKPGLEHGLVLGAPPLGHDPAARMEVGVDLSIGGNLLPRLIENGGAVGLFTTRGEWILRYGRLAASDTSGKELPTRIELRRDIEGKLSLVRISIDDADAAYPILVRSTLSAVSRVEEPTIGEAGPHAAGDIAGTPEAGAPGIAETVEQIMKRQAASAGVRRPVEDAEREISNRRPFPPVNNPLAPALSQWPPPTAERSLPEQLLSPQSVGTHFRAVNQDEAGYVPPDSMGDVGETQILVHVNGRVRVFSKTGSLGALNATDAVFWSSVDQGLGESDPGVRYDRLSQRWFLVAVNLATTNNRIMLAVSSGPTITGSSSFTFYQFQLTAGGGPGENNSFCDYPSLGVDAHALYIGCNMFNGNNGSFSRVTVYVVRKSSVLSGGPIVVTAFRNLSGGGSGPGPWAPRGVDNDDPLAAEGYFVGVDIAVFSLLQIRRVSDPGGMPTLSGNLGLTVPTTTDPILQPAFGSSPSLDTIDDRLFAAAIHENKITGARTLTTAHHIQVNASCVASATGGRNGARWYQIGSLEGAPSLVQSGTLCDPSAANPRGYTFPSVAQTGQGHLALGSTFAAANLFAGASASGRLRGDAAGSTQAATTVQSGLAQYTITDPLGRNRWGDYSFSGVDPADDQTVWTFQEYADTPAHTWAVRAIQLRAPPPASPSSASPSSICAGVPSSSVTLTGTSTAGSEFFDPGPDIGGPGYANHLSASASGGVFVGSATFVDPTHIVLDLDSTLASAGLKSVTVTNPDGQVATGVGLIQVRSTSPPAASNNGPICAGETLALGASTVAGGTYSWTGPDGFTSSEQNPSIPGAGTAAGGTYSVTVTVSGCTSTGATTTALVTAEGEACSDGDACTTGDACGGGACVGTPVPSPGEVGDGVWLSKSGADALLTWSVAAGATASDVVRGSLSGLPVGPGGGDEVCLADGTPDTLLTDATDLSPGDGFWYLVRGASACGVGPYGYEGQQGAPGAPRGTTTCP